MLTTEELQLLPLISKHIDLFHAIVDNDYEEFKDLYRYKIWTRPANTLFLHLAVESKSIDIIQYFIHSNIDADYESAKQYATKDILTILLKKNCNS